MVIVCYLLATGRWGASVGIPDTWIYVTDMALVVTVAVGLGLRQARLFGESIRQWPMLVLIPLLLLLAWAAIRFATSWRVDRDALRDVAPFGYLAVAFLAAGTLRRRSGTALAIAAMIIHTAWLTVSLYWPDSVADMPRVGETKVLQIRTDYDGLLCGVAAALFLFVALRSWRWWSIPLVLLAAHDVRMLVEIDNRASLMAGGSALLFVTGIEVRRLLAALEHRRRLRTAVAVTAALIPVVAILGVLQTTAGARLVSTFTGEGSGTGTTSARQLVYEGVWNYLADVPSRLAWGVGFGPDFLTASHTDRILEGSLYSGVRSPHMFILGTLARLGFPGAVFQLVLVLVGIVLAVRMAMVIRRPAPHEVLAGLLLLALPIAGAVGVILESPFGAVPYAWAIGVMAQLFRTGRPVEPDGT